MMHASSRRVARPLLPLCLVAALLLAVTSALLPKAAPAGAPRHPAEGAADLRLAAREAGLQDGFLPLRAGVDAAPRRVGFDAEGTRAVLVARFELAEGDLAAVAVRWPWGSPRIHVVASRDPGAEADAASASLAGEVAATGRRGWWRAGGYFPAGSYDVVIAGAPDAIPRRGNAILGEVVVRLEVGASAEALLFEADGTTPTTARGSAPALALDRDALEVECPSLPTNVARGGHSAGSQAAPGAPRTLEGLVRLQPGPLARTPDAAPSFAEVDPALLADLLADPRPTLLRALPLPGGGMADFFVAPFEVFTPDARIVAFDGTTETELPPPPVRAYQGGAVGDAARDAILVVTEGEGLRLMVRERGGETLHVGPDPDQSPASPSGFAGAHLARLGAASPGGVMCAMEEVPENREMIAAFDEATLAASRRAETCFGDARETQVLVDVNYALYTGVFGSSTTRATSYAANLFAAASAVYQRDINNYLVISTLVVWTETDPFTATNSNGQLRNYRDYNRANRAGVARDVAHLLAEQVNFGGIAYLNALCRPATGSSALGFGVSNIFGNVTFPPFGYTWDVSVVAHELGHNFGSPHTHCYSPPIDCCYNEECACGTAIPQVGTLMSYCHLNGSVSMDFHPRCIDVMRAYSESLACIVDYEGDPERRVIASNAGDAPLTISAITVDQPEPWLALCPAAPLVLQPGEELNLHLDIACADVPSGTTVRTITIASDDPATPARDVTLTIRKKARLGLARTVSPSGSGSIATSPAAGTDGKWEEGTSVQVTAFPALGWQFVRWEGDATGTTNFATLEMTVPRAVTAVFEERRYGITMVFDPAGAGTVTYDPAPDANNTWPANQEVTVTAVPNPGFAFIGWEPGGTTNPLVTTMTVNRTILAKFKAGYRLTVVRTPTTGGTVRAVPTISDFIYAPGQVVSLQALPAAGHTFLGWSGDVSGTSLTNSVTMNGERTVIASFQPPQDTLTIVASPAEGGAVAQDPAPKPGGVYDRGTVVTLTAQPAEGYAFVGWSGASTATTSVLEYAVNGSASLTAHFALARNALVVALDPADGGSVDLLPPPGGDGKYALGEVVALTAAAAPGFTFLGWSGDASGTDATVEVTVNGPRAVTARFQPPQYALALDVAPPGGGGVVANPPPGPGGRYDRDTVVTLTAQPAPGFSFVGWGGAAAGETSPSIEVTMTGDLAVSAEFATRSSVLVK